MCYYLLEKWFFCDVPIVNHGENCLDFTTYAFYLHTCQFASAGMLAKLQNFLNLWRKRKKFHLWKPVKKQQQRVAKRMYCYPTKVDCGYQMGSIFQNQPSNLWISDEPCHFFLVSSPRFMSERYLSLSLGAMAMAMAMCLFPMCM